MLLGATWKVTMHIVFWFLIEIFEIDEHSHTERCNTDRSHLPNGHIFQNCRTIPQPRWQQWNNILILFTMVVQHAYFTQISRVSLLLIYVHVHVLSSTHCYLLCRFMNLPPQSRHRRVPGPQGSSCCFFRTPPHTHAHTSPTPLPLATNLPSISKIIPCVICHPYILLIFVHIFYLCFNRIGYFKVQFWEFIIHSRY